MENSFGKKFRISISGASHSPSIMLKMENIPAGIELNSADLNAMLLRRKIGDIPHLAQLATTPRKESDTPIFKGGVREKGEDSGKNIDSNILLTTGEPLTVEFANSNIKSGDYSQFEETPRPGHADFVNKIKYSGNKEYLFGGGISSGRLTLLLVTAGYVAKQLIGDVSINARITHLHGEHDIAKFEQILTGAAVRKDSVGGVIECSATNLPIGIGEPFFDSLESVLSHLAFSVPGIKGIEFGNGFACTKLYGSENNDLFIDSTGKTLTNNSGGISGGISNGNPLIFRVAVRPPASIGAPQHTFNFKSKKMELLSITGRHDICFALRMPVIVESITAIAIAQLKSNSKG